MSQNVHRIVIPQDIDDDYVLKEGLSALSGVWRHRSAHPVLDRLPPETTSRAVARRPQGFYDFFDAIISEEKKEMRESRSENGNVESQGTPTTAESFSSSLNDDKGMPSKIDSSKAQVRNGIIEATNRRLAEEEAESKSDDNVVSEDKADGQMNWGRVSSFRIGGRTFRIGGRKAWSRVTPSVEGLLKLLNNCSCPVALGEIYNKSNGGTAAFGVIF